ncbi:hypothetical protein HanPI659440_Chr03g0131701 [Helianthus annuus]|nr:hypothetical protein HanPI659440_Chr03g0131701 [Helianthus annuus]
MDELKVSLCRPSQICEGVSIWEWSGLAWDEGDEASKWFINYLGKPSRLMCFNEAGPFTMHYTPMTVTKRNFHGMRASEWHLELQEP